MNLLYTTINKITNLFTQRFYNNEIWVEENIEFLDPKDPNKTFNYVARNHPYSGVSTNLIFSSYPNKDDDLETLAKYADAVTVCCYEFLGHQPIKEGASSNINETSIGNVAYIALHHPNESVRKKFMGILKQFGYIG